MRKEIEIQLTPEQNGEEHLLRQAVARHLNVDSPQIRHIKPLRRSIDARKRPVRYLLKAEVWLDENAETQPPTTIELPDVSNGTPVIVVGAGPAGLFAALRLIELGLKPIVLERGKDVRTRRRDLVAIHRDHVVDPDSNYCFGEGGAGTYSDGKLYTRSKKRGNVQRVLHTLVRYGATDQILVDAHPHIGTNKLPKIIASMRESILNCGGEVHFSTRVTDFEIANAQIKGAKTADGQFHRADYLILATGHSARDIFTLLHRRKIEIEAKPFALGVRIEHPQTVIDQAQYHCDSRGDYLPPASYSLVQQVRGKGVYSFCMCPGGIIAPCATAQEEVVTNGWSPSKRNNPFANSGIVVAVNEKDWRQFASAGPLAALRYQQAAEKKAWIAGGKTQRVPAQRMIDFIKRKPSQDLPASSYQPGTVASNLHEVLPPQINSLLAEGLSAFGRKMKGYYSNEAVLHAVESRTSSPVRIPRSKETLEHTQIEGLFPCGEGAGYAGGIVSAAIDGERCAEQIAVKAGKTF